MSAAFSNFNISIHALHYRVRPVNLDKADQSILFQSTHSITECDSRVTLNRLLPYSFQSTHSITECDILIHTRLFSETNFNPRTPLQSATNANGHYELIYEVFQSTHSITECDDA